LEDVDTRTHSYVNKRNKKFRKIRIKHYIERQLNWYYSGQKGKIVGIISNIEKSEVDAG
jgi:hypothetical protein